MINAEQIRMARAYLDWSTADLAAQTGLTVSTLNRIERANTSPSVEHLKKIEMVFDAAGIAFLPFSGVTKKDRIVELYEGPDAFERHMNDILVTMRENPDPQDPFTRAYGVDESRHQGAKADRIRQHIADLARIGVSERLLIKEGDRTFLGPIASYHWLPEAYFSNGSFSIYGPKVAMTTGDENNKTIVVINDPRMAESIRALYDYVWDATKGPSDV